MFSSSSSVWYALSLLSAVVAGVDGAVLPVNALTTRDDPATSCQPPLPNYLKKALPGTPVCQSHWVDGKRILGMAFFSGTYGTKSILAGIDQPFLARIETRFDDGTIEVIGQKTTDGLRAAGTLAMGVDEVITRMDIAPRWYSGDGQLKSNDSDVGGIYITTTSGQSTINGPGSWDGWDKKGPANSTQNVGGGILIGVSAIADDRAIHSLNFNFSPGKIISRHRHSMTFNQNDLKNVETEVFQVTSGSDCNAGNNTSQYTLQNTKSVMTSVTTTHDNSYTVGASITATEEVSVPLLAKFSLAQTVTFSTTISDSTALQTQSTTSAQWTKMVIEQPHQIIDCVMSCGKATGPIPYTAIMTLTFSDGSTHDFVEHGNLAGNIFSNNAESSCVPRAINWNDKNDAALCGKPVSNTR